MTDQTTLAPSAPAAPGGPPAPYHRLLRAHPRYRWWRPIAALACGVGVYVALVTAVLVPAAVWLLIVPGGEAVYDRVLGDDMTDPVTFASLVAMIALMLPAVLITAHLCGGRHALRGSVTGRLRWGLLNRCLGWAALVLVPGLGLLLAFSDPGEPRFDQRALVLIALTLLLVPFQAAAEEYVFRGLFLQAIGSWLRHPAWAILLPVPLFVLGHGYDLYGQLDVAIFAVAAGWLTWRTGGLEAAIALHVVNNVVLFLFAAVGLVDPNATEGSAVGLAVSVVETTAYVALVVTREPVERPER